MEGAMSLKPNAAGLFSISLLIACGAVSAQDYPNKPVRMVVGSFPGGGPDFLARILAQGVTDGLGRQVVVDNRGNGAGELVSRSLPDGYTLLVDASSLWISPLLQKTGYDFARDFAPVTMAVITSNALVVHPTIPVKSVKELIAFAKPKPGALNYGSAPTGSNSHLSMELFKSMAHVDIRHIPYRGTAPAVTDIISGQIHAMFANALTARPQVESGKVRALGVSGPRRIGAMPDVPPVADTLRGYDAMQWYGLVAPAKTPRPIIMRIHAAAMLALKTEDMKEKLAQDGAEPEGTTPESFAALIKSELEKWAKVAREANIEAQ